MKTKARKTEKDRRHTAMSHAYFANNFMCIFPSRAFGSMGQDFRRQLTAGLNVVHSFFFPPMEVPERKKN